LGEERSNLWGLTLHADATELGFEDRLGMLVEREALERDTKRLATQLKFAGLRQQATPETSITVPPVVWIAHFSRS
jgi:hypothetical protein